MYNPVISELAENIKVTKAFYLLKGREIEINKTVEPQDRTSRPMPASATDRELKRLRKRIWENQLQDHKDKRELEFEVLHLSQSLILAHTYIGSLTEATRKLAVTIKQRLGEKSSPPERSDQQLKGLEIADTAAQKKLAIIQKRDRKIRLLEKKLEEVKADYNLESADKEIIDAEEPVEEFVREVFRDANSSRRPKRKRYTPQRCMKKEE